jgi:hypothetical protein
MAKIITRNARPDDLMFSEGVVRHSLPFVRKLPQSKSDTASDPAGHSARASETGSKKRQDPSTRKPTRLKGGPVDR